MIQAAATVFWAQTYFFTRERKSTLLLTFLLTLMNLGLGLSLSAVSSLSQATESNADLRINNGWVRLLPPVSKTTAAYFELHNLSDNKVKLLGASTPLAKTAEFHRSTEQNGMAMMDAVEAVIIPAKSKIDLSPGGLHLMLMNLTRPLSLAEEIPITLIFENHANLTVKLPVRREAVP